jgi:nitroreductase
MMGNPILQRRAVRKYESTAVAGPDIEKMVAAFETAPCGMHQVEDMQATVVTDETLLKKIATASNNACYGAPLLFVISTKKTSPFGDRDASAAAENVMVQAAALDLGSVYVMSGAQALNGHPDLLKKLGVDDCYAVTVIVAVGHPAGKVDTPDRTHRYKLVRR